MFCSFNLSLVNSAIATIVNSYFAGSFFAFYGTIALGIIAVTALTVSGVVAYKKHKGKSKRSLFKVEKEKGQTQSNTQVQQNQQTNQQTQVPTQSQSRGNVFQEEREKESNQTKTQTVNSNETSQKAETPKMEQEAKKETKSQPIIKQSEMKKTAVVANHENKENLSSIWNYKSPFSDGKEL